MPKAMIRARFAAVMYQRSGFGKSLVVGREADVKEKLEAAGLGDAVCELEAVNAAKTNKLNQYKDFLYDRLNAEDLIRLTFIDLQRETGTSFQLDACPWGRRRIGHRCDTQICPCHAFY